MTLGSFIADFLLIPTPYFVTHHWKSKLTRYKIMTVRKQASTISLNKMAAGQSWKVVQLCQAVIRLELAHTHVSCTQLLFFDVLWCLYYSVVPLYRLLKRWRVRWYFNRLNNRKGSVPALYRYTVYKINLIEPEAKKFNKNASSYTFGYIYLLLLLRPLKTTWYPVCIVRVSLFVSHLDQNFWFKFDITNFNLFLWKPSAYCVCKDDNWIFNLVWYTFQN